MSTDLTQRKTQDTVATPSVRFTELCERWKMIDDLCGGTRAMRAARNEWLPMEDKETDKQYEARLKRSVLYAALRDTIDSAVAKPFSQPIALPEVALHEKLSPIETSTDRKGQSLTSFGAEVFKAALKYNHTHVIVDYPPKAVDEDGNARARSLGKEREDDIRPYFVHVKPTTLIGIRREVDSSGVERVTMARIKEKATIPKGTYSEESIYRITLWTETEVVIFESKTDDPDKYSEKSRRSHTFGSVPLKTLYLDPEQGDSSELPFEDLGWLNITHWQSMSDQRNILRVARVPFIHAAGFTKDELGDNVAISAARFIRSKNPDSKIGHVEHTGKAIEAGEKDLMRLEERMIILGLQPFVQQTGTQTATGKAIDQAQTHTQIQAWIRVTEAFILDLYRTAAEWINAKIPEAFAVSINNDFGFTINADKDVANLIKARIAREISYSTFINELKRRGFFADSVDPEAETEALAEEVPEPDPDDVPDDEPEDPPKKDDAKDKNDDGDDE